MEEIWNKRRNFPWMGPFGRPVRKLLDSSKHLIDRGPFGRHIMRVLYRSRGLIFRRLLRRGSHDPKNFRATQKRCIRCSRRRQPPLPLCESCRHLPLLHLFFCGEDPNQTVLCTTVSDTTISDCPFCQLITHIARSTLSDTRDDVGTQEMSLFLRATGSMLPHWPILLLYLENSIGDGSSFVALFSEEYNTRILEVPFSTLNLRQEEYHSLVGSEINWQTIRSQLAGCVQSHQNCRDPPSRPLPQNFYLIDIWNQQIVLANSNMVFVALSYVWGDNPDPSKVQAKKLNLSSLSQPGGLRMETIPKTIRDAMQCCLFLGQRYLWADRLCIVQDDPESRAGQIDAMDAVFSAALLVLIDVSGIDMDSGIAGISRKRYHAPTQKAFHVPGLGILSNLLPSLEESLLESKWMTRGWTYQEAALARRKLFFTTSQVYFVCETSSRTEDGTERFSDADGIRLWPDEPQENHFSAYAFHLHAYTGRSLRYQSDICNAFVGIVHALYPTPDCSIFSMPRPSFNRALRWSSRATRLETRSTFPSWAWSSIAAEITYAGNHFCGALVRWFELYQCQDKTLFLAIEAHEEENWFWGKKEEEIMALSWSLGCIERPLSLERGKIRPQIESRWPDYSDFFVEAFSGADCNTASIMVNGAPRSALVDCALSFNGYSNSRLLFGRAQKASFNICYRLPDPCKLHTICRNDCLTFCYIMDDRGSRVGALYSGEHKARVPNRPLNSNECTRRLTFIALSISNATGFPYSTADWCECNGCKLDMRPGKFKKELDDDYSEPVVDVLVVEKRGDFFYRLNRGFIVLQAWVKTDRIFEDIVLA